MSILWKTGLYLRHQSIIFSCIAWQWRKQLHYSTSEMQALWGQAWTSVMCTFLWFEAAKWCIWNNDKRILSEWLFLLLLAAATGVSWSLCLRYSSLRLARLSSLCSAVSQSVSRSLCLISLSSLAFLFASLLQSLVSLVCCFICLPFSSPRHCGLSTLCSAVSCLSLCLVSLSSLCPFALQPSLSV